jgi:hypothetical protein
MRQIKLDKTKAISITGPTTPLPQINVYPAQFFLLGQDYLGVRTILGQVTIQKWDNFGVPGEDGKFYTHSFNISVVLQPATYNIGCDSNGPGKIPKGEITIYLVNEDGKVDYLGYVNQYGLDAREAG